MREAFFMLEVCCCSIETKIPAHTYAGTSIVLLSSLKYAGTKDQRKYEEYQEDKEQYFGNGRSTGCDATKSEDGGYQSDNEKCDCPA